MTDIVALDAQRPLPEHVPPELVYDYPLTVANKTTENPFDRMIPEFATRLCVRLWGQSLRQT